jgi:PLP dependent protein
VLIAPSFSMEPAVRRVLPKKRKPKNTHKSSCGVRGAPFRVPPEPAGALFFLANWVILRPWLLMISENIARIRRKIAASCMRAGRDPAEVMLIAVTKTFPSSLVREAVQAGVRDLGENYVQELLRKRAALEGETVRWHFIGHLQSNKVKQIAPWIAMVHAVDSPSVARELDRQAAKAGRSIEALVEVNTTGEASKYGLPPDAVAPFVREIAGFEALRVRGLMTIGPFLPDPEGSRPMFRRLRELSRRVADDGGGNVEMQHLSMGMSGDYEVAIEEGATMIRLGTAIFGARPKPL